ncbi:MAG: methyltransferase domain-containing protein [Thermodesulfobacteriota bacterium]|nr:methyltransferase domain-containing protein [Thermodesulfobacteriota bacterium]
MDRPLEEKYELEVTPMAIGGKRLHLHRVANWDIFVRNLEEQGEAYVKKFPFWVRIWEASVVLADHLVRLLSEKEMEILEIGAGMGITGLFLGAFGHKVTLTDYEDDALALLRMNVAHNGLKNVSVERLDWNDPELTGKYDVVCGSELLYDETSLGPIMGLFRECLRPEGAVFLAHDVRRRCLMQFIGMVPGLFEIKNVGKTFRGEKEAQRIIIHALRIK